MCRFETSKATANIPQRHPIQHLKSSPDSKVRGRLQTETKRVIGHSTVTRRRQMFDRNPFTVRKHHHTHADEHHFDSHFYIEFLVEGFRGTRCSTETLRWRISSRCWRRWSVFLRLSFRHPRGLITLGRHHCAAEFMFSEKSKLFTRTRQTNNFVLSSEASLSSRIHILVFFTDLNPVPGPTFRELQVARFRSLLTT